MLCCKQSHSRVRCWAHPVHTNAASVRLKRVLVKSLLLCEQCPSNWLVLIGALTMWDHVQGPCPECGMEATTYFGDIFTVKGARVDNTVTCSNCKAIINVNAEKRSVRFPLPSRMVPPASDVTTVICVPFMQMRKAPSAKCGGMPYCTVQSTSFLLCCQAAAAFSLVRQACSAYQHFTCGLADAYFRDAPGKG